MSPAAPPVDCKRSSVAVKISKIRVRVGVKFRVRGRVKVRAIC